MKPEISAAQKAKQDLAARIRKYKWFRGIALIPDYPQGTLSIRVNVEPEALTEARRLLPRALNGFPITVLAVEKYEPRS